MLFLSVCFLNKKWYEFSAISILKSLNCNCFFTSFHSTMPSLQSDIWKHFTEAKNDDGKTMFLCNYCSQKYVKNATKMQNHLHKCKKIPLTMNKGKKSKQQQLLGFRNESPPEKVTFSTAGLENLPDHGAATSAMPSTSAGQSSQRSYFLDSMDEETQKKADESLARAIYATGSPLNLTSNVYLQRCFKVHVLRPAYKAPTQHALDSHLLESHVQCPQPSN